MISKELKIVFMGTPKIAADILEQLILNKVPISAVITRPDKPSGRGGKVSESDVKIVAQKHSIPVYQPASKSELEEITAKLKPNLNIVAAFGMILPKSVFDAPRYKTINVHFSLLPLYRGPAPIVGPILAGDKKTGVTIMLIDEKMDEGDILSQEEIELSGNETAPELAEKLTKIGGRLLVKTLPDWVDNKIKPTPQDHLKATCIKMITKEDGKIDFQVDDTVTIERKSRAYDPWPGVYSYWNDKKLDLYDIKVTADQIEPGKVTEKNGQLLIGTKKGAIFPKYLKLEGKNKITAEEFLRGYSDFTSSKLI